MNMRIHNKKEHISCLLHSLSSCDNISLSDVTELQEFMKKESKLKEVLDLTKIKHRPDGRVYIYINRKQIISSNYAALIDSLYEYFFGKNVITIEDFFPQWMVWRRDNTHVSNKTLKENLFLWNSMFKDTDIMKLPISSLKAKDFISFFRTLTKDGNITRKRFNDGKSILNSMFYYAVELEIVDHNPLKDINYRQFKYKAINEKNSVFTLDERKLLLNYLLSKDDIFSFGISLHFSIIARIGELKSLKWSDISGNTIRINTQLLEDQTMNDDMSFNVRTQNEVSHVKGNTSRGFRDMPLTPSAIKILERIKVFNPNGEYILMHDGEPLTTVTYNRHLKSACESVGIPYRSSHKIRFTVASLLYKNGLEETKLQEWLGHSTLGMTLHYLKNVNTTDEDYEKMIKTLE
jgi:integrase